VARDTSQGESRRYATAFGARLDLVPGERHGLPDLLRIGIRPEHVQVRAGAPDVARGECAAVVMDVIYRGSMAELVLQAGDRDSLFADLAASDLMLARGDRVAVRLPERHVVMFPES
jgi:hypothetical protein